MFTKENREGILATTTLISLFIILLLSAWVYDQSRDLDDLTLLIEDYSWHKVKMLEDLETRRGDGSRAEYCSLYDGFMTVIYRDADGGFDKLYRYDSEKCPNPVRGLRQIEKQEDDHNDEALDPSMYNE